MLFDKTPGFSEAEQTAERTLRIYGCFKSWQIHIQETRNIEQLQPQKNIFYGSPCRKQGCQESHINSQKTQRQNSRHKIADIIVINYATGQLSPKCI